jgi:hypothetical protein
MGRKTSRQAVHFGTNRPEVLRVWACPNKHFFKWLAI